MTWGDPLTHHIPEDQTRLGDDALTLHELAAAEHRAKRGTLYRSDVMRRETVGRRILRRLRRIVT